MLYVSPKAAWTYKGPAELYTRCVLWPHKHSHLGPNTVYICLVHEEITVNCLLLVVDTILGFLYLMGGQIILFLQLMSFES